MRVESSYSRHTEQQSKIHCLDCPPFDIVISGSGLARLTQYYQASHLPLPTVFHPDTADAFVHHIRRFPLLTPQAEKLLFATRDQARDIAGNPIVGEPQQAVARRMTHTLNSILTETNYRLVAYLSRRFPTEHCERIDHIQNGVRGLQNAVEGFQVDLGYKFSSYAVRSILTQMKRDSPGSDIRRPKNPIGDRIDRVLRDTYAGGQRLTYEELATLADVTVKQITEHHEYATVVDSLDREVGDGSIRRGDVIGHEDPQYNEREDTIDTLALLESLGNILTPAQMRSVRAKFVSGSGLGSVAEAARILGVTPQIVRKHTQAARPAILQHLRERGIIIGTASEAAEVA